MSQYLQHSVIYLQAFRVFAEGSGSRAERGITQKRGSRKISLITENPHNDI